MCRLTKKAAYFDRVFKNSKKCAIIQNELSGKNEKKKPDDLEGTFIEQVLQIERIEDVLTLFGNADQNVKIIEEHFGVNIVCRGTEVKITG